MAGLNQLGSLDKLLKRVLLLQMRRAKRTPRIPATKPKMIQTVILERLRSFCKLGILTEGVLPKKIANQRGCDTNDISDSGQSHFNIGISLPRVSHEKIIYLLIKNAKSSC